MTIIEQQIIANELLDCLEIIAPHSILAGGAPRDWYLGKECNDLDFYISLPEGLQSDRYQSMIDKVLLEGCKKVKENFETHSDPMYKHMEALRNIYYYEYKGIEFQLIRLESVKDVYKAVSNMSCSICKAWYKGGKIGLDKDFKLTVKSGMMFLNDKYKWSDYHPKKMCERFGDEYVKGTKERAIEQIVNKGLEGM